MRTGCARQGWPRWRGWPLETPGRSTPRGVAGALAPGRPADFAILDHDPFVASPARQASRLTVAGGRVTWADGPFAEFAPASLARLPPGSSVDRLPPYPGRTR